jgi:SAM-dependent methyltransferase
MHIQSKYKTAHVLDVGCGKDQPLARLLYTSKMNPTTGTYTGVDYNKLEKHPMFHTGKFPITLIDKTAFPDVTLPRDKYDVIVSFEVLEHVEPAHSYSMLKGMKERLADGGDIFISTPCYDAHVGAAGNHVNEMSYEALGAMIQHVGLAIVGVWGTFASQRDYKEHLKRDGHWELFEKLSAYYDSNYLATIFAPLYPALSRNCLWHLRKTGTPVVDFPSIKQLSDPLHSSSETWTSFVEAL